MSLPSTRDPYDLDRLAEELVAREGSVEPSAAGPSDFPVHVPLSHDNKYLSAEEFNIEEFLLSRAHLPLPDLRTELRDYLSTLKEELVKLINDDYEAFISLSTDLRGDGVRLERLKAPLAHLKAQILVRCPFIAHRAFPTSNGQESKAELCVIHSAIQEKLEKRATLREEMVTTVISSR